MQRGRGQILRGRGRIIWPRGHTGLEALTSLGTTVFNVYFNVAGGRLYTPSQLYCKSLCPLSLLVDQRKLWLQTRPSDNVILRTMSVLNRDEFVAVCSKYSRDVDLMTPMKIKDMIWDNFACTILL